MATPWYFLTDAEPGPRLSAVADLHRVAPDDLTPATLAAFDAFMRSLRWRLEHRHAEGGLWSPWDEGGSPEVLADQAGAPPFAAAVGDLLRLRRPTFLRDWWTTGATWVRGPDGFLPLQGPGMAHLTAPDDDWATAWEGPAADARAMVRAAATLPVPLPRRRLAAAALAAVREVLEAAPPAGVSARELLAAPEAWVREADGETWDTACDVVKARAAIDEFLRAEEGRAREGRPPSADGDAHAYRAAHALLSGIMAANDRELFRQAVDHAAALLADRAARAAPGLPPDEAAAARRLAPAVARALPLSELLLARAAPGRGA